MALAFSRKRAFFYPLIFSSVRRFGGGSDLADKAWF